MSDILAANRPKIISVTNQKGGVGKTTTTINLGAALAELGKRVLIIDLDPQGNASTGLGIEVEDRALTTYELLLDDVSLNDAIYPTDQTGLFIVPSTVDLSSADMELISNEKRSFLLHDALRQPAMTEFQFDYILIDCPPSLNLMTVNAMVASDSVLIPLQSEFFALEGLTQLMKTIERIKSNLNPSLEIRGILLTMFDKRNKLSGQVEKEARNYFKEKVYSTAVPRNVRLSEAPSHGIPVLIYDKICPGSKAYFKFTDEFLNQDKQVESAA